MEFNLITKSSLKPFFLFYKIQYYVTEWTKLFNREYSFEPSRISILK